MFKYDVPLIFGENKDSVVLHMDSASSHTAVYTTKCLHSHDMKYTNKEEWLPNSPKLSPMDYFANGHLKQQLQTRKYRTMRGLIASGEEEWSKIPQKMFSKAIASWEKRMLVVHKAKGHDVPL